MLTARSVGSVTVSPASADQIDLRYEVWIGPDALADLPRLLELRAPAARYALIADDNTGRLYGEAVRQRLDEAGFSADLLVFPAGESSKTRESWAALSDRMLEQRYGRDSAVLALGGGVVGDLAGFVAATYMRGLPLVQLPTTLLAMIDSSVGGKTGVDTPAGKNLIGSFHQPRFVVADTDTLRTLPPRELSSGLAEAVKHGAIADSTYFNWISDSADAVLALEPAAAVHLIRRSVEIKAGVVGADERESGLRKILNFGHTIGHAIEALSGYELLHGEAIAIGMIAEARLGEALGVTAEGTSERVRDALRRFGLPTVVPPEFATAEILAFTRLDKKARAGAVEYSLLERIGSVSPGAGSYGIRAEDAMVSAAIEASR